MLPSSHLSSLPPAVHFGLPSGLCYSQPIDCTVCNQVQVQVQEARLLLRQAVADAQLVRERQPCACSHANGYFNREMNSTNTYAQ